MALGEGSNTIRARAVDTSANTATVMVDLTVESGPSFRVSTAVMVAVGVVVAGAAALTVGLRSRRWRDTEGGEGEGDKGA